MMDIIKKPLTALTILVALWLYIFFDGLAGAYHIWVQSETFAHGFLIIPISIYLIWQKRELITHSQWQPNFWLIIPVLANIALWLLGNAAQVNVLMQFSAFAMLPLLFWMLMGNKTFAHIAFACGYLIFAVPMGSQLIPQLQQITAEMSVAALKLTGIPVYREGLYIFIPTGTFEVAVACSGIRYLLASLAVGTLYAYLSYNSWKKRLIFCAFSLILPIIANGLRAYGIIIIAHLSDMQYAVGADHLVYGWAFFGILIFIMFSVGNIWQDQPLTVELNNKVKSIELNLTAVAMALLLMVTPIIHQQLIKQSLANTDIKLDTSFQPLTSSNWQPNYDNASWYGFKQEQGLLFYKAYYASNNQNELIRHANHIYDEDKWSITKRKKAAFGDKQVNQLEITSVTGQKRTVWYWYQVCEQMELSPVKLKLKYAAASVIGKPCTREVIAVSSIQSSREVSKNQSQLLAAKLDDYLRNVQ